MGGSMGGLLGLSADLAYDDPALDDFADALDKDTSALVLVGEEATLADFDAAAAEFDAVAAAMAAAISSRSPLMVGGSGHVIAQRHLGALR